MSQQRVITLGAYLYIPEPRLLSISLMHVKNAGQLSYGYSYILAIIAVIGYFLNAILSGIAGFVLGSYQSLA